MDIFKQQVDIIYKYNLDFYNPINFEEEFNVPKIKKKILLTIDDGFSSFYNNAWPYLKKNKIPFIIFISTEAVGKKGYIMVESYRNEQELFNLECWALTAESLLSVEEWIWCFKRFNYSGDYEFIYF